MRNRPSLSLLQKILVTFTLMGMVASPGCGTPPDDTPPSDAFPSSAPPLSTVQPDSTPQKDSTLMPSPVPTTLQNLIDLAKTDLAKRLAVPATEITVVDAKAVTWSDASLGCPQEGFAYAQVLTPGHLIILEHAGNQYEYHAGKSTEVIYCTNPLPPVPGDAGNT